MWIWIVIILAIIWTYYTYSLSVRFVNNFNKLYIYIFVVLNTKFDGAYYVTTMQRMITLSEIIAQKKMSEYERICVNLVCLLYDVYHEDEFADVRIIIDNVLKTEFKIFKHGVETGIRFLEEPFKATQGWLSVAKKAKLLCNIEQQILAARKRGLPAYVDKLELNNLFVEDCIIALDFETTIVRKHKSIMELLYNMHLDIKAAISNETDAEIKAKLEANATSIMEMVKSISP